METEVATTYSQERLPVWGGRQHLTHRYLDLYFVLATIHTWMKMEQRFTEWTTNELPLPKLKLIPWQ